jgi:hypothetical protein
VKQAEGRRRGEGVMYRGRGERGSGVGEGEEVVGLCSGDGGGLKMKCARGDEPPNSGVGMERKEKEGKKGPSESPLI